MRKFATCMVAAFKACRGARPPTRTAALVRVVPASSPRSSSSALARVAPRYVQRGGYLLPAPAARKAPKRKAAKKPAPKKTAKKKAAKKAERKPQAFVIFDKYTTKNGGKLATVFGKTETQAFKAWSDKHPGWHRKERAGDASIRIMSAAKWRKQMAAR